MNPDHLKDMEFVKLTAKPDTWFDEGTEVFIVDLGYGELRRRVDEFAFVGVKTFSGVYLGLRNGEWDEEFCPPDEFDREFVKEEFAT